MLKRKAVDKTLNSNLSRYLDDLESVNPYLDSGYAIELTDYYVTYWYTDIDERTKLYKQALAMMEGGNNFEIKKIHHHTSEFLSIAIILIKDNPKLENYDMKNDIIKQVKYA